MNKKVLLLLVVFLFTSANISNASGTTNDEYFNVVSSYIKGDKIEKIKDAPIVNIKAMLKGMNLGYLDPKLKEIRMTKENVDNLIKEVSDVEISNSDLKKMNEELITRLTTMSTYLERSGEQYEKLIGYDRHYIGKYCTLKLGEALFTNGADDNLKFYNSDYKEVKRIYKDIKEKTKDL